MIRSQRATGAPYRTAIAWAALALLLAGCSSLPKLHWPFGKKPVPPPQAVNEIVFAAPDGSPVSAFPQYWKRNTLIIDLQAAGPSGRVLMRPRTDEGWPVRLAFRVVPGAFAQLEVRGEQRTVLPVSPAATGPIELQLAPSVYRRGTESITLEWGAMPTATAAAAASEPASTATPPAAAPEPAAPAPAVAPAPPQSPPGG